LSRRAAYGGIVAFNKKTGNGFDSVDAKLLISIASEIAGYLAPAIRV